MIKKSVEHEKFFTRTVNWFRQHPWLILIAFLLAVMTWLYVRGELIRANY